MFKPAPCKEVNKAEKDAVISASVSRLQINQAAAFALITESGSSKVICFHRVSHVYGPDLSNVNHQNTRKKKKKKEPYVSITVK